MRALAAILLSSCLILGSSAAGVEQTNPGISLSIESIRQIINDVENTADLAVDIKEQLLGHYGDALAYLEKTALEAAAADTLVHVRRDGPAELQNLQDQLAKAPSDSVLPTLAAGASLIEVKEQLQQEKGRQATLTAQLSAIDAQHGAEMVRPDQAYAELAEARRLAATLKAELDSPPSDENPLIERARRQSLVAHIMLVDANIRRLDEELLSHPIRGQLLLARWDVLKRSLNHVTATVEALDKIHSELRRDEVDRLVVGTDIAKLGDAGKNKTIQDLAQRNRTLAELLESLTADLEKVKRETATITARLEQVRSAFKTTQQRIEIAGMNPAVGKILHEQRRGLPNVREHRQGQEEREKAVIEAGLRAIGLETERRELIDRAAHVERLLDEVPEEDRLALRDPLQQLVAAKQTLLTRTITANGVYLDRIAELDFRETQLIDSATEFGNYLEERLIWLRSSDTISLGSLSALPHEVARFFSPNAWLSTAEELLVSVKRSRLFDISILLAAILLWRYRSMRTRLRSTARDVGWASKDSFAPTMEAIGLSILMALPLPLLCRATGWILTRSADASDDAHALGTALIGVTQALFFLIFVRMICIDGGLAQGHFRWPAGAVGVLRREANLWFTTFVIASFIAIASASSHPDEFGGELSRITFLIATGALSAFVYRLAKPGRGFLVALGPRTNEAPISWMWSVFGLVIPLSLAVATLMGYTYSAATLMGRLSDTVWLVSGLLFLREIILRWLTIIRERLAVAVALEKQRADHEAQEHDQDEGSSDGEIPQAEEPQPLEITGIDEESRRLLNLSLRWIGILWVVGIWSSILPALGILGRVTLWNHLTQVGGELVSVPVMLTDLGIAILTGLVTVIAIRNVPWVLNAILQHRQRVNSSARLAVTGLVKYTILVVGLITVAGHLGFDWSKLQWLVAALGVGIGFGLQEIVANFISGMIILFERPIRIGDIVSVSGQVGVVRQIRFRATMMTTFDREVLVVPNKEFVTGRILNWSLSDDAIRVTVSVGVAFGTDMKKTIDLVTEAAQEHERVIDDPSPSVWFTEFGDNALEVVLHCFIRNPHVRASTASALRLSINEKFNAAGIEVSFPQRDVHLDTLQPLDVRINQDATPPRDT